MSCTLFAFMGFMVAMCFLWAFLSLICDMFATRLSRQYMDEHFKTKAGSRKRKKETLSFEPKDCYTIGEIAKKFHINDSSVFKHIRRHSIPTRQIGNYVYVPKSEIDKLYKSL